MSVVASMVVGADGSTSPSTILTNQSDRSSFLALRSSMDCIITGGETFRNESYQQTPVPLIVLSRTLSQPNQKNPSAHFWKSDPEFAISRATKEFGQEIHVECGPVLLQDFLDKKLIDRLHLTVTTHEGGSGFLSIEKVLSHFESIERTVEGENRKYCATKPRLLQRQ